MLKKLLKYDLKSIYKVILIFYALALIFAIIARGLTSIDNSLIFNILGQIAAGIAISMTVSAMINTFIRVWVRFINNVYKDESYLTHTLPISKKTIYLSKFLSAIITMFTTVLVIIICLAICYYSKSNIEGLKSMLEMAANVYESSIAEILIAAFVIFFLEMLFILLAGYTGIIIGHKSSSGKTIKSIAFSFLIYIIVQSITVGGMFILALFNPNIMNLFTTTTFAVDINSIKALMYFGAIMYFIYIIALYIIDKKQLEKGVNID